MLSSGNRDVHVSLVSSSLGAGATYSAERISQGSDYLSDKPFLNLAVLQHTITHIQVSSQQTPLQSSVG